MSAIVVVTTTMATGVLTAHGQQTAASSQLTDPSTGTRWLLVRDSANPAAPAHLRRVDSELTPTTNSILTAPRLSPPPVIRAGDPLSVIDDAESTTSRFTAHALAPAPVGSLISVRLDWNGSRVMARILGPSLARIIRLGKESWQ